jgi:hypothetical protein
MLASARLMTLMKGTAAIVIAVGTLLLVASTRFEPYTDNAEFERRYHELSRGQSAEFHRLRHEMLTPKYRLQDLGITAVAFGGIWLALLQRGAGRITAPRSYGALIGVAIAAPALTAFGNAFDLNLAYARGEFPHWADSMGIPITGVPAIFVFLLVWSVLHLLMLRGKLPTDVALHRAFSRKANPWLSTVSVITVLLIALMAYGGSYSYALPGLLWLYFYLSLASIRREQLQASPAA